MFHHPVRKKNGAHVIEQSGNCSGQTGKADAAVSGCFIRGWQKHQPSNEERRSPDQKSGRGWRMGPGDKHQP
jgi:hypothetical protein